MKLDKLNVVAVLDSDVVGTFTMSQATLKYLREGGIGKPPSEVSVILNLSATIQYSGFWYQIHVSAIKVHFFIIIFFLD